MGGRKMANAVHLEGLRCDGAAHGGCQAGCLIFWKEAWLKRAGVDDSPGARDAKNGSKNDARPSPCTEEDVRASVTVSAETTGDPSYVCQSTRLRCATQALPWWDLRQYVEDFNSCNVRISQMLAAFLFFVYQTLAASGLGVGAAMRWSYDVFQRLRGGAPYPRRLGRVPDGARTPTAKLNLQEGEAVRVKSYREILETLDTSDRNRGLYFDQELVPFCNGTFRVLRRVQRTIDEKTGKMIEFKSDALILEGVHCQARYSTGRRFCPRSIYPFWREIWLERATEQHSTSAKKCRA
jgi:hypothetical protein